jgi:GNAT superfamily N-acetyltransferase
MGLLHPSSGDHILKEKSMKTKFRNYTKAMRFTEDFHKVRDFLVRINEKELNTINYDWSRWEWGFSLPYLDEESIDKIGLWEAESGESAGQVVGLVTYETCLGEAFLVNDPAYGDIREGMLGYAITNLKDEAGKIKVYINDNDRQMQLFARARGLNPTQEKQPVSLLEITNDLSYDLPEGFSIVSMRDEYDIWKFGDVLFKGFNHGDNPPRTEKEYREREISLSGPHSDLDLKIAVKAPNGEFASFCGMWYDPRTSNAYVEPVATNPKYRRMGLGKAAVLEGVIRCGKRGAKLALVGSSQQFYYSIGFDPMTTDTAWTNE